MIRAVIFDVDDTLYSYKKAHAAAFEELLAYADRELGISPKIFAELHGKMMCEMKRAIGDVAAIHNRLIRYQRILEELKLPLHPHALEMYELYWGTLMKASVPSEGARETMEALKAQGIRIGIGTDMTAYMQFKKLTGLGLMPYIDFFVSSEEAGAEKPHPSFFANCVAKAGCERRECLFVGDSLKKDVLGAMEAGLNAVWYCPEGTDTEAEVPRITNMMQLCRMAEKL